ncbi:matrix metallopeptidase 30 [Siphateles boraxobius]|uniref:matrix metallopeptidase 30 n=1 Tax=Siphateles boraxobius TaxID=180520 RepID=UPI004064B801
MRRIHRQLGFLASLLLVIHAGPITEPADEDETTAEHYLKWFYNLTDVKTVFQRSASPLTEKMKEMQKFFRLNVTGTLDRETLEVMKKPRCGVPDVAAFSTFGGNPRWKTNKLTYRIENYTPDMSVAEVDDSIRRALQVWADVTPLRFTRIYSGTADIMISFATRNHGDGYQFDGPQGVLAHAFAPSSGIGGDAHFDDDEIFSFRSSRGIVLFLVAAHEFGHSLGLSHSNVRGALMFPTYSFSDPGRFSLTSDDIRGIQSLYGPNRDRNPIQPDPELPTAPNVCDPNLIFDAVTTFRGETMFFKDSFFWRSSRSTRVAQLIKSFWPNSPDNIDAAYETPVQGKVIFFKGKKVWAFNGNNLEPGYPKILSHFGLPLSVRKVNAAVHDKNSRKTLLFVGKMYYSYDERAKRMDTGYPKRLAEGCPGMAGEVTAAHLSKGYIYLYSGTKMYMFRSNSKRLLRVVKSNSFMPCLSGFSKKWNAAGYVGLIILKCLSQKEEDCSMGPVTAFVLTLVVYSALCDGAPTASSEDHHIAEAYLSQFYRDNNATKSRSRTMFLPDLENELKVMQEFFGLEVTGKLDSNTLETMKLPRCGVTDVAKFSHFQGRPSWKQSVVTYRITEYTSQLSQRDVDVIIAKAFQLYSDVIPLDFKQIYSGTADIMILFKAGYHGDFYPFDGPNGVLAHANSPGPEQGGDTHFDDDETWTLSSRDINLLLVAAHEFGHALGLDHSKDPSALMYPTYRYVNTNGYTLPRDDRLGVQALYGVRTSIDKPEPKPEPKPNSVPSPPEPCKRDLVFDAATSIRGELYFFKAGYYWKKGYYSGLSMHEIKSTWPSIDSVDAAYEFSGRDISFIFNGQQYWGVKGSTTLPGYPKPITKFGFPTYVKKIDAAVHVKSTGRTLFFVGSKYWSFNERTAQMDRGFPKNIQLHFPGIGSQVDAAFENYGYLYFSEGPRQTEYDFSSKRVNRVLLNYGWLNCY